MTPIYARDRVTVARMGRGPALLFALFITVNQAFTVQAAPSPPGSPADNWSYADIADLFAPAPLILHVRIADAIAIKSATTAPGAIRFYVQGDVIALIRGASAVPPRLAWLVDVRPDSRGKLPKLTKANMIVAASPVAGRPGELRLIARDAQVPWTPALEARVRALVTSVAAPDAVPHVTGITSAFHSAGSIPGEGETQIFLSTATGAPISISVLRRPGERPRWAFAQGEIVDEAATPPAPDTLAWYRLACWLPRALPSSATQELPDTDAAAARDDYAFVIDALGTCARTRG